MQRITEEKTQELHRKQADRRGTTPTKSCILAVLNDVVGANFYIPVVFLWQLQVRESHNLFCINSVQQQLVQLNYFTLLATP